MHACARARARSGGSQLRAGRCLPATAAGQQLLACHGGRPAAAGWQASSAEPDVQSFEAGDLGRRKN